MQKYHLRKISPKAKTSSMFYRNKKTIRKEVETPLCSENLKKKKINNNQVAQKEELWKEINSNINQENNNNMRNSERKFTNTPFTPNFNLNDNNSNENKYSTINYNDNTNDNKIEIINLTNEKINLNNNNIKLLQLLNENNEKNTELKNYIEEYRKKRLLTKAKFLRHLDKLKHRSKEINLDSDILQRRKTINYNNINEIKKENEYLIKKIKIKNNDFQNLYDFMMEIISYNEPYVKEWQNNVNELSLYKNNKLQEVENSFNKNISSEIIKMKNDYEKLKIKYNELLEKMKNEDEKEEQKQKVKFVVKNISEKTKKEYEEKIQKLKEENNKLINDYKKQEGDLKNELENLKNNKMNKDKEFETLNDKYEKIIQSLNDKINNNKNNKNEDINV